MISPGQDLIAVLNQVRDFFGEVASLLLTADSFMAKSDWVSRTGNTATAGLSYSLYGPRQWLPNYLYRCYENKSNPLLLPLISTIIGVGSKKEQHLLPEPLICAALYEYETQGEAIATEYKYQEFASWHIWMPNRKDDGSICRFDPRTDPEWAKECSGKSIQSIAVPLFDIVNAEALKIRIVDPLLRMTQGT